MCFVRLLILVNLAIHALGLLRNEKQCCNQCTQQPSFPSVANKHADTVWFHTHAHCCVVCIDNAMLEDEQEIPHATLFWFDKRIAAYQRKDTTYDQSCQHQQQHNLGGKLCIACYLGE